jgi:outer membrane protein OmpA-like peptidoglycan-associated protein/opacity protein-like surface antigen
VKNLYSYSYPFRIIYYSILVFLLTLSVATAQTPSTTGFGFQNTVIFGVGGGVTFPQTDYETPQTGYAISGAVEYYFKTNSIQFIGFKLNLNFDQVAGEDSRGSISTQDGSVIIPPKFSTGAFSAGLAVTYGILIGSRVIPYVSGGAAGLWFDPTNGSGQKLSGNAAGLYSTTTLAYNLEGGVKIFVSDKVSINLSATQYWPQTDYLDDVDAAFSNDAFTTVVAGVSFAPFYDSDPDKDGISNNNDICPNEPEDFDGFEDEDGCPDLDNDSDGILDAADKCPNEAEDFDGFEDEDGCPDLDNDGDGILDIYDECPNEPEDINGTADDDGCPDIDELAEDGKIILECDEIFEPNSAMIMVGGQKYLDDAIIQLKSYPDKKWRIEGHMDSNGNKRFIRSLSLDRAKAVLEYFTYFGELNRENFQVFGMADNFPVAENNTEEGRAQNRRIEIIPVE